MSHKVSRRLVARYAAEQILSGDKDIYSRLAAYLIQTKSTRDTDLYIRDIESALLESGVVVADVLSARELADKTKRSIIDYIEREYNTKDVELRQTIDPDLIGGVQVRTADAELDASVRRKLTKLQTMKV